MCDRKYWVLKHYGRFYFCNENCVGNYFNVFFKIQAGFNIAWCITCWLQLMISFWFHKLCAYFFPSLILSSDGHFDRLFYTSLSIMAYLIRNTLALWNIMYIIIGSVWEFDQWKCLLHHTSSPFLPQLKSVKFMSVQFMVSRCLMNMKLWQSILPWYLIKWKLTAKLGFCHYWIFNFPTRFNVVYFKNGYCLVSW